MLAAQQGSSYIFPPFKHRHKPKGCDSLSDAFLKKKKNRDKMNNVKNPLPTVKIGI